MGSRNSDEPRKKANPNGSDLGTVRPCPQPKAWSPKTHDQFDAPPAQEPDTSTPASVRTRARTEPTCMRQSRRAVRESAQRCSDVNDPRTAGAPAVLRGWHIACHSSADTNHARSFTLNPSIRQASSGARGEPCCETWDSTTSALELDRFPSSTARTKNHLTFQRPRESESAFWAHGVAKSAERPMKMRCRFKTALGSQKDTIPTPIATCSKHVGRTCPLS